MQIGKIGLHKAQSADQAVSDNKVSENKAAEKMSTNPFGVSFKGNILQADVFQKHADKAAAGIKGKLSSSAAVSGINAFNQAFKARMNAIGDFAKKMTSSVFDKIEKIGKTEITWSGIMDKIMPDRQFAVKRLAEKPVSELSVIWSGIDKSAA